MFSFPSLNRFFALSFDKIGCISTIKIKVFWTFILYCLPFSLSLQSGFGRSVDRCPFCGKIIKRLLIIRMFEKLAGGKDRQKRIMVNVHVMRGRLATSHCNRFPPSNFERGCNIVHVFHMGTCREFFRLLSDALITKNVLMQIWLNR